MYRLLEGTVKKYMARALRSVSGDLDPGVLVYLIRENKFDGTMLENFGRSPLRSPGNFWCRERHATFAGSRVVKRRCPACHSDVLLFRAQTAGGDDRGAWRSRYDRVHRRHWGK